MPIDSACCTIMPTIVRSGAPTNLSVAIERTLSMVSV